MKQGLQIVKNMGTRYMLYRVRHEWEKRMGVLKKRHPVNPVNRYFLSLKEWRGNTPLFVIPEREKIILRKTSDQELKERAMRMINGEVLFFSNEWKNLGVDYDWVTNPDNGYKYDVKKHWSELSDFSPDSGDIKYVWEKSRFTYLLSIIRHDYHHEEDHSEFVFTEIEKWIDANPVNRGPNWRCSQEISLRILNWCYALHFYKNSPELTEERWRKIQNVMYWSLHHVYHHIDFSRIAVRNNHAITETLFLCLGNILFPFIPETKRWSQKGRKWFEEEIAYQIYDDGTFLQFSMNYHRVVIQLLSLGISLTRQQGSPFSEVVYEKAYKSLDFLYQCLQEENGFLPNYGANDGAWFFPLSDTDYRDFRPQLNTLHKLLTGEYLYTEGNLKEESYWMNSDGVAIHTSYPSLSKNQGLIEFPLGGYYLIREKDCFTFIKCGSYKDRPSHADNLHIDIWYKGENILFDAGSFKYNTDKDSVVYFSGTESHNTVMLGGNDQMRKGPRFIWFNWTQAVYATLEEEEDEYRFSGAIRCFTYLNKDIVHKRTVTKKKDQPVWEVKDEIANKPLSVPLRQLWHTQSDDIDFSSEAGFTIQEGWRSLYYGKKEKVKQIEFATDSDTIVTTIRMI
mgnify:CR=1 FL=1